MSSVDAKKNSYDDDIVISGLSGKFPESNDVDELWENLITKTDMIPYRGSEERMPADYFQIGEYGKVPGTKRFDNEFFRISPEGGNWMSPESRMCLETAYEAIVDAGQSIESMAGTNTGVFYSHGATYDAPHIFTKDPDNISSHAFLGLVTAMIPNRVSYYFDLRGRSVLVDSACSSSLSAFDLAVESIRNGSIDAALVGGAGLAFGPNYPSELKKFGVVAGNRRCKVFDVKADGYVRGEAVGTILLQKKANARRCYATVVQSASAHDGKTASGLGATSCMTQHNLIKSVLQKSGVDQRDVDFIETHGTGTQVGDNNEVKALGMDGLFIKDRKQPLLIGSIKSNMGHSECVSGLPSLTKAVLMMHHNIIPPNLHYEETNPKIDFVVNGDVKVVSECTPYQGGHVGVNSFGVGGSISHILLAPPATRNKSISPAGKSARLFTYNGRCEEGLKEVLAFARKHETIIEVQQLLSASSNMVPSLMPFRGYTLLNSPTEKEEIQTTHNKKRPVWFVFPGLGCQWLGMGKDLLNIPIAKRSIERNCKFFYDQTGYNLMEFFNDGPRAAELLDILPMPLVNMVQVALVDILKAVGIEPDGILGHSNGEVASAYADGCITGEESVFMAYLKSAMKLYAKELTIYEGIMASVGLSWMECQKRCPPSVKVVCHNGAEVVTISGLKVDVEDFVQQLNSQGIFAKLIPTNNMPYHHPDMCQYLDIQRKVAKNVLNSPKPRSSRWICTSYPEEEWGCEGAKYASKEYFMNNSLSIVYFHEAVEKIPKDALVIEIGPHPIFSSLMQKTLGPNAKMVSLMKRNYPDSVGLCLSGIGKCFLNGVDVQPLNLHKLQPFPVPSNVPIISPAIVKSWDHSSEFRIPLHTEFIDSKTSDEFKVSLKSGSEFEYLNGHNVDGKILFPASGYIYLAWKALAKQIGEDFSSIAVKVEGAKFGQPVVVSDKGDIVFHVNVLATTGHFEIMLDNELVAEGRIKKATPADTESLRPCKMSHENSSIKLESPDVQLIKENISTLQRVKGFQYTGEFNAITRATLDCTQYVIEFNANWVTYLNAVMQASDFSRFSNILSKPISFDAVIDPTMVIRNTDDVNYTRLDVNSKSGEAVTCGVKFSSLNFTDVCRKPVKPGRMDEQQFFSFFTQLPASAELQEYLQHCQKLSNRLTSLAKGANESKVTVSSNSLQTDFMSDASCGLAELLEKFVSAYERRASDSEKELLYDQELLKDDQLLHTLCNPFTMKKCLDVVARNIPDTTISILDLGDQSVENFKIQKSLLKHEPCLYFNYTACSKYFQSRGGASTKLANIINWQLGEKLISSDQYSFIIASNILHKQHDINGALDQVSTLLNPGGFLMVREITQNISVGEALDIMDPTYAKERTASNLNGIRKSSEQWKKLFENMGFEIIMEESDSVLSTMFFLRKKHIPTIEPTVICVDDLKCGWVEKIKEALPQKDGTNANAKVWLVSTNPISGVIAMTKVLLHERYADNVRCIHVSNLNPHSKVPDLSPGGKIFQHLQAQDLGINTYRDGSWGSMYRMPVEFEKTYMKCGDASLRQALWGDISTIGWVSNVLSTDRSKTDSMTVYCIGLNNCDLSFCNGDLSASDLGIRDNILGFDVSGRLANGKRVMAVTASSSSTVVDTSNQICLDVPDTWKLEQAATVPLAYTSAVYGLVIEAHARKGERVLVHSGMSHVGQAALHLAIGMGCDVFTTVKSDSQKKQLKKYFPSISDSQIALITDMQFVEKLKNDMDIILNLFPGDHVQSSIRMMAAYGKFVDIECLPKQREAKIDLSGIHRGVTYHRVNVYKLLHDSSSRAMTIKGEIQHHLVDLINAQAVKPLPHSSFGPDDVMDALEYMQDNEDGNKVLIKLQADNPKLSNGPKESTVMAQCRTLFKPSHSYVIMGGLGGFGLEIARWMVSRGCRKLVLSSRSGLKTGLQHYVVNCLRLEGATVVISSHNAVSMKGADDLLKVASDMGPLGGVFNLSVVLLDKSIRRQTVDLFNAVCDPKIQATMNLDKLTREKYKNSLDMFVAFSSQACAQGIPCQTNYAFANSGVERICEQRCHDNLPGKAIQWGIVGDVGFVASLTKKLTGFVEQFGFQPIMSCLDALDQILLQPAPVISSFAKAGDFNGDDDDDDDDDEEEEEAEDETLLAIIGNLLGLRTTANLEDSMTLKELGIDSIITAEVKELLETYNMSLSDNDVRSLSVETLRNIDNKTS